MLDHRQHPPLAPFTPPSRAEREALDRASAYLHRAGNEVESRSLMAAFGGLSGRAPGCGPPAAGLHDLHQSLRAAAALCAGIAEDAEAAANAPAAARTAPHPSLHREASG